MLNERLDRSKLNKTAEVWYCTISKNESLLPLFENSLAQDELVRAGRFKFRKDRDQYVISKGVLRILLGQYLEVSPAALVFKYTPHGKPFLPGSNLKFNVSHSGDMAAFAFIHDVEVGVDIERIKADFDVLELARNFFAPKEIEVIEKTPLNQLGRAFFRCWTRKESFIKAEGSGLSFPLDQFTVSLHDDLQAVLERTDWEHSEKDEWSLFSFVPDEAYIGALAVRAKAMDIAYMNWDEIKARLLL